MLFVEVLLGSALILPEEQMNFKLSNIPGNSVYINSVAFLGKTLLALSPAWWSW